MNEPIDPTPVVETLSRDDVTSIVNETLEDDLRALHQKIDRLGAAAEPARRTPTGAEYFHAAVEEQLGDASRMEKLRADFALAEASGTTGGSSDASGLMPQEYWGGGLVNVKGGWTPLFDHIGRLPYPSQGSQIAYPVVASGPSVAARSAQNEEASSTNLVVNTGTATVKWFSGALRVPMELIEQSTPEVMTVLFDRLVAKFWAAVEADAVTIIEAAATAQGAGLTTTNYGTIAGDLITESETIRVATDLPGNLLGCPTDDWIDIIGLVDGSDRRQFAVSDPQNSDGQAGLLSQTIDIGGGVRAFHAAGLTTGKSLQFNQAAVKGTSSGPRRVSVNNVADMGVDVGLLGSSLIATPIAAGIIQYSA